MVEVQCETDFVARTEDFKAFAYQVALHVHTSVSDDAIRLYGFLTAEELALFRLLIGVERIGPKAALGIPARNAACAGVPWKITAPAGVPKKRDTSAGTRPKLFCPMLENPVSCRRVVSKEKK